MDLHASASSIERLMACGPSSFLPQADSSSRWSDRGDTVDGFTRAVMTGTPIEHALSLIEDKATRETCRKLDFRRIGGDLSEVRCQVSYAIDIKERTARELGVGLNRDYASAGLGENEIPGTNDMEGIRFEDDAPCVPDVKAGYRPVTRCEDNGQVRFYCCAKMLVTGAPAVEGRVVYVKPSGEVDVDSHLFTRFDLDLFLDDLEDAVARAREHRRVYLAGGQIAVATGEWCRYCPAISWCPEHVRLAKSMLGDIEDIDRRILELTREQAGQAYRKACDIETILERVFGALKARARQEWLPTAYGKVLRPITFERQSFNAGDAIALLRQFGATDEQIGSLYRSTPVEQVKETKDPRVVEERPRKARKRSEAA